MKLKIKKLHPDAVVPAYATDGSACFDLCAVLDREKTNLRAYGIEVTTTATFSTGLAFEVPPGNVLLIFSRSGHGFNGNTRLANCVGVIDSDYRGEVKVKLTRDHTNAGTLRVYHGDRIAQAMLVPIPRVQFVEVDELSETARGTGGFGSTGA